MDNFSADWSDDITECEWKVIKAMANNSLNVLSASQEIFIHRNTFVYHLNKIYRKTHLNPRNFYDLCKFLDIYDEMQEREKGNDNMFYVVKSEDGNYWCGLNKISEQLRKAQIYVSKKYALEVAFDCSRKFPSYGKFHVVTVELKEMGDCE